MADSKLVVGRDGKPRWLGTKQELEAEHDRAEEALAAINRQLDADEALMGDRIEEAMLEIPQSPALALAKVMMQRGLDPTEYEHYREKSRRRGFLWPTTT